MKFLKIVSLSLIFFFLITNKIHGDEFNSKVPETEVSADSINFGEVIAGDSLLKSITLYNIGDEPLSLDSLINVVPDFRVYYEGGSSVGGFDLAVDDSISIFILFKPENLGESTDTVFIKNSLATIGVSVSGTSIAPAKIEISPESFEATIIVGDSVEDFFSIENTGGNDLTYNVSISKGEEVLFSAIKEDLDQSLSHIVKYSTETYEPVDTLFTAILEEFRVVSLAYNSGYLYFQNFYDRSDVHVLDVESEEIVETFKIQTEDEILFSSLSHSGKNLYAAVNDYILEVDQENGAIVDTLIFESVPSLVFISVNESANVLYKNSGNSQINIYDLWTGELKGNLIDNDNYSFTDFSYSSSRNVLTTLGRNLNTSEHNFYSIDVEDGVLLDSTGVTNGSFVYALASVEANLTYLEVLSETIDTLAAGVSNQIDFEINAEDLLAGEYSSEIKITSNDPLNGEIKIPIVLTVEGGPEISVYPQSLDLSLGEGELEINSLEITNTGFNSLNYRISSLLKISEEDTVTFFTSEVHDSTYFLEYSLFNSSVISIDTLLTTSFGAFGIRGVSVYKNGLFFIDDKDNLSISVLDIESKTVMKQIDFGGFIDLNSLTHYRENLLGILGDFGASSNQYIVQIDQENGIFSDTLLSNSEFGSFIQSISVNTQKDELFVLFSSSIEAVSLTTGERREILTTNEDYSFQHFSYSPTQEQLYVSGYDLTKPEGSNLGIFTVDAVNGGIIDFIEFHQEFGEMSFDETGNPAYIELSSDFSGSIDVGLSKRVDFRVDAAVLAKGEYLSEFIISSNDPDNSEIKIPLKLTVAQATSAEVEKDIPTEFELSQNYPNPFNPSTNIAYGLPGAGNVQIKIYNVLGQEVMTLVDDFKQAGRYTAIFDARNLSSGMYFYRMVVDGRELEIKKMLLLK